MTVVGAAPFRIFLSSNLIVFSMSCREGKHKDRWPPELLGRTSYSFLAAAELAREHFNGRNPAVVPELQHLPETCKAYFPPQTVVDSQLDHDTCVEAMWDTTTHKPCAVLGPLRAHSVETVMSVTSALKIPQLVYFEGHEHIVGRHSDNIAATVLSTKNRARLMTAYLQGELKRNSMSVIHENPDTSADLITVLEEVDDSLQIFSFVSRKRESPAEKEQQMRDIKNLGIKSIFINVFAAQLGGIAELLDNERMLDGGYLYILSPHTVQMDAFSELYGDVVAGSALDRLLMGAMVFDRMDGFRLSDDDPFLTAWQQLNETFVDQLNTLYLPLIHNQSGAFFDAQPNYFQTHKPVNLASYVYDAVMSIGMGACQSPNKTLHEGILQSKFFGASGRVSYNHQGDRDLDNIPLGVYNIRRTTENENGIFVVSYQGVLTDLWTNSTGWKHAEDFVYADGSTVAPSAERDILEENFLSAWQRGVGLSLMVVTWLLSLGCVMLLQVFRQDPLVQRSQPFFMVLICVGSVLMATSIFTLSWDEGEGWSEGQLDTACMMTPWFFFVGQITVFASLISKLWRVDTVLQWRRRAVTVQRAIIPAMALLALTVAILVVWTVVDPWQWERHVIREIPSETYGQCENDRFWAYFGPLMALLVSSESLSAFYAWKTLDVPEDFGDSKMIFYAIFTHLQAWVVGVPILTVLGDSSAAATYFGRVFLVWIFAVSSVALVVVPTVYRACQIRLHPDRGSTGSKKRVSITGIAVPSPKALNGVRSGNFQTPRDSSGSMSCKFCGRSSSDSMGMTNCEQAARDLESAPVETAE